MVWMSDEEIDVIKKYLSKDKIMLEYGSGGSTTYFSEYVEKLYSIEHNQQWYTKVKNDIVNKNNINLNYCGFNYEYSLYQVNNLGDVNYPILNYVDFLNYCKENYKTNTKELLEYVDKHWLTNHSKKAKSWDELKNSENYKTFKSYIEYPLLFQTKFDVVFIDGRSRPECAYFILENNLLNDNGVIIMHDFWQRAYYYVVLEKLQEVESVKTGQSLIILKK